MESKGVYKGGAATGVHCANPQCGTTSTSGSWRRGWPVDDGENANLCNRCGQRWAKDKQAFQVEIGVEPTPAPQPPSKKRSPAASSGGHAAAVSDSPSEQQPPSHKRLKEEDGWAAGLAQEGPLSDATPSRLAAAPPAVLTPSPKQFQPLPHSMQQARYVSYTIQKQSSSRGNHALFWLQDEHGGHTLAVVGTDARLSGHFTYATTPGFSAGPPLRCTNRTEVTQWLASFGVREQVPESSVGRLPELDAAEKKRLLTGEPVWAKPQLEAGVWAAVREESGRLVDGRHFKRFFLLGAQGQEKLAVTGVDSMRKDRRYKYCAEPALGGFAFENSREVLDWLNFVLDRPSSDPVEPQQVRAPKPLTEEELGTAAASHQPNLTVRTKAPAGPKPPSERAGLRREVAVLLLEQQHQQEVLGPRRAAAGAAAAAIAGAGRASGAGGGFSRPPSQQRLSQLGSQAGSQQQQQQQQQGGGRSSGSPVPVFGGKVRPMALAAPRFRCACCGMTDHDSEDCPLAALQSPTMLIRRPTLDRTIFQDPSLMSMPSLPSGGALLTAPVPTTPQATVAPASASGGGDDITGVLEFAVGERDVSARVKAAYKEFPRLHQWVAATPSAFTVETFRAWADRLAGHISEQPPPLSETPEDEPLGGWRWVPTPEALGILQQLNSAQVGLALLESTGISRAVAMLRTHNNDDIARLAEEVVTKWRACAVAALHHATAALDPAC
ncbi:hypothetical protein N2152v2_005080 [Parachlorella kessleri]